MPATSNRDQAAEPAHQTSPWGATKWLVTPGQHAGADISFGEVVLCRARGTIATTTRSPKRSSTSCRARGPDGQRRRTVAGPGRGHDLRADRGLPLDDQHGLGALRCWRSTTPVVRRRTSRRCPSREFRPVTCCPGVPGVVVSGSYCHANRVILMKAVLSMPSMCLLSCRATQRWRLVDHCPPPSSTFTASVDGTYPGGESPGGQV